MRHRISGYKLGRDRAHRIAFRRNLARSLFLHGKVVTTHTKAKAVRPFVEKLITLGKRGDLAARRRALALLPDKDVVKKLFDEVAPKFQDRPGGYTRILKKVYGKKWINRLGDNAKMAILELVSEAEDSVKSGKKSKRKRRKEEAASKSG